MHIYKKVLPAAVALALAACGGGSDTVPDQSEGATQIGTFPRFDPLASDLPLNTDIVFAAAATSDGTADVGAPTNPVEAAINGLDGFSTSAYFDIGFAGGSIDPASLCTTLAQAMAQCASPNVFLIPLDTGSNDALDPANIVGVQAPGNWPAASAEVVSLDGGTNNVLRVIPQEPLQAKTKYLVFVTNGVLDSAGDPITPSSSYNTLGETTPAVTPALQPVRDAIAGWETIASGVLQTLSGGAISAEQAKDSIAISYTFTTTDPQAPLVAMAAPRAALVQAQVALGIAGGTAVANSTGLEALGLLSTPKARDNDIAAATAVDLNVLTGGALPAGVGSLYTGFIKLPYYLTTPDTTMKMSYTQDSWVADQTLGGALSAELPPGAPALPPVDADGVTYNVTYRYPFAAQKSVESVPLQVTLPEPDHVPANPAFGGADCQTARPAGYPVVIYIHGITSDRASVVALAHTLASVCVATVAIDLPLHGVTSGNPLGALLGADAVSSAYDPADVPVERHFGDPGGSGAQFINLGVLNNTRDNMRQSVMDMLNLNASLDSISTSLNDAGLGTLDTTNVKTVGVSLGGIVGAVYATVNQKAIGAESLTGFTSNLKPLDGLVVSAGGSQLTQILNNSQTFGPVIEAGLAAEGVQKGTTNFERFLYVAQSAVDSGDPVNFAETLGTLGVPVLVQQIVGGGDASGLADAKVYTADKVVPNSAAGAPLAGTTPLAALLGAGQVGQGPVDVSAANALVNLTIGHHASLLRPNEVSGEMPTNGENVATAELQTQVASFVLAPASTAVGSAPNGSNTAAAFIEAP